MAAATTVPGLSEQICQPFWDTFLYPVAGQSTTPAVMFQKPRGAGVTAFGAGAGTGVNTLRDTNMSVPGQLPGGFTMDVRAIAVVIGAETPTIAADLLKIAMGGVLVFTVGQKVQHQQPLIKLPGGAGITGAVATTATTTTLQGWNHGSADPRAVYSITVTPIIIEPSINFDVTLLWPSGGVAVSAATPITVFLEGYLTRPAQ